MLLSLPASTTSFPDLVPPLPTGRSSPASPFPSFLPLSVNRSKVKQHRRELKQNLVANVQENVDQYPYIYVFGFENMRTQA